MSLWFKELPPGWEEAPLKSRLARNDGGVWGEDPDGGDSDTIVLRSTEQRVDGAWNIEAPAVRKLSTAEAEGGRLEVGDLVVTKSSGSELHIGKTSLVTTEVAALNACYSNFMQRLRVDGRTEPRFVHYWMNNELCREQFAYLSNSTSGLANLNGTVLGTALLAFPPKDKQERIANFLDEQTARIDALIAEKERLDGRLQEYRSSLISAAVTGQIGVEGVNDAGEAVCGADEGGVGMTRSLLTSLPEGWRSVPAKHATSLNPEVLPESTPEEWELSYVDIAALEGGDAAASFSPKELTFGTAPSRARRVLRGGDTILSTVRTYLKAVANFPEFREGLVASTGFVVLRPNGRLQPRFAYWAALSEPFIENVVAHSEGVSYPAINPSVLGSLHMPVPPLDTQERIANFLDEQTTRIDALRHHVHTHIARLREYRSSLISAAVTGQLDLSTFKASA